MYISSSAQTFKASHLLVVPIIIISVFYSACARPSPSQGHLYPIYTQTSLAEQSTAPQNISLSSSPNILERRMVRSCDPLPLTPETWNDLELDFYLKEYPDGDRMTLIDYATSKNASNFVCGIGSICNAGQMCYPVNDNDWYILFAIQQWNSINNMLFMAIGYAISIVQATVNSLISTMFPAVDISGATHAKQSMAISAGMMEVSGTLAMDVMLIMGAATGPVGWALNVLNFGAAAGFAIWAFKQKVPKGPIMEGFGVWTDVVFHLANVQREAHNVLSEAVKKVINSPISSKDGIYGVLKGGAFMSPAKVLSIPEVADQLRKVTMAMSMNLVLRAMNAFIAVGADECYDKGQNGAWPQKDLLSYCPKHGGPMYNIIRAVGDKSENAIPNANVINDIFGFPTQLIVDVSVDCQKKYGGFNHNPYVNGKFPKSEHDDCVFNIPVCDCQSGGTRASIKDHHQHVAEACRKHGGLPI